jgi:hypothetical protein
VGTDAALRGGVVRSVPRGGFSTSPLFSDRPCLPASRPSNGPDWPPVWRTLCSLGARSGPGLASNEASRPGRHGLSDLAHSRSPARRFSRAPGAGHVSRADRAGTYISSGAPLRHTRTARQQQQAATARKAVFVYNKTAGGCQPRAGGGEHAHEMSAS